MLILAGDVGGTNTRLQLTDFSSFSEFKILTEDNYRNQEHESFIKIVELFLQSKKIKSNDITGACFAIAGPIIDGKVEFTNLPWTLSELELKEAFAFKHVTLMNDFEAAGYGINNLKPSELHVVQEGIVKLGCPRAMIGAGTGLGVSIGIGKDLDYRVIPTEGGHVDFAPTEEVQIKLLRYLQKKWHRVSVERVVSGQGIANIYAFVRDNPIFSETENPTLKRLLFNTKEDLPARITEYAITHHDPMAMRALAMFISIYGAVVGNLALSTLPFGGLYIMGGIAPKMLPQLTDGRFLKNLTDKGRMSNLLKTLPIYIVLNTQIGLRGAANFGYLSCI